MLLDDCFEIGFILKPHGLKGAVNIHLDVDDPEKYKRMESVIIKIGDNLVPFFISNLQVTGNKGILQLQDINTIEEADNLKSCALLLPLELLPELENDQFYYHEVIGYQIIDHNLGKLGVIEDVYTGGIQDLISMKYKGKEILIPVNDDIVGNADHKQKIVFVQLPVGLLEIYL
jgi:16S rRNA processing protein RimM